MRLAQLDINHVRNLVGAHLECCPGINCLYGENAAGKTAVLEAIHLLARARSFRTPRIGDVIQHGRTSLTVVAQLVDDNGKHIITGLDKSVSSTQIRFNGARITRRSEQAQNLPLLIITPDSQRILAGTPRERRHWLDWAMFHMEPDYIGSWQNYYQALRHRNILLRKGGKDEQFSPWENAMADAAERIIVLRRRYISRLQEGLQQCADGLFKGVKIAINSAGDGKETYLNCLRTQRDNDIRLGHTQSGPHREDITFYTNGHEAGKTLSRGEGKLFVILLMLVQAYEYQTKKREYPLILMDDLSVELDGKTREVVFALLSALNMQIFITATTPEIRKVKNTEYRRFHVKQGKVTKVVK